ncbi:MAG TPA: bifunctional 4-hydroxy-2-oxoglutarate aldolase/2-dehydro-3-deoxy-phosphogluconate aldolase [Gemmatimonadaceae bacterium]|nr:bifunctional 4-hydroxy-2-oxoglutarate aldolase/2-dehydro-3-deoxy-phosphogluconate aldolase [Gemmatimonadaceae bacterium]
MKGLLDVGIIPVIRCDSPEVAVRVTEVLISAGLRVAEITLTVPRAIEAITQLARRTDGERAFVGAGTVTTADEARDAIAAGAKFIVSPCLVHEVIEVATKAGVPVIPGALTPTEILEAIRCGADLVKVFPVASLGGPAYIKALRGPFPDLPLVPTGGVDLDNVADFMRAGATAVGVGSELVSREALARGDYDEIGRRAEQFVRAVANVKRAGAKPCF